MSKEKKQKDDAAGQEAAAKKDAKKDHKENKESPVKRVMIVRVAGKDLDGSHKLSMELMHVRGVSFALAKAVSGASGIGEKKVSDLTHEEILTIEGMLRNPQAHGVPSWLLNRRGDPSEGRDRHIVSADLDLTNKTDINELKKKRCYKGVRHTAGLPVRGQRTRSSFRKSGKAVGVNRVKAKAAKSPAPADKKK